MLPPGCQGWWHRVTIVIHPKEDSAIVTAPQRASICKTKTAPPCSHDRRGRDLVNN
jgi:hypothetical protein